METFCASFTVTDVLLPAAETARLRLVVLRNSPSNEAENFLVLPAVPIIESRVSIFTD